MSSSNVSRKVIEYDDHYVRLFMLAGVIWGAVGMVAGLFIALQLHFSFLNFQME